MRYQLKVRYVQDVHDRGIYTTLPGHEGTVTCVRFRGNGSIVSGDSKGVLKIWRVEDNQVCVLSLRLPATYPMLTV